MWAILILPLIFGLVAASIYSWYFGVSKIWAAGSWLGGAFLGGLTEAWSQFSTVIQTGISNFGDTSYIGMSMLAVVLIFVLLPILVMNVISTINTNPTMIR